MMACPLGTPNVLLDNSYGKCSAYFNTWSSALAFTRFYDQGTAKRETWTLQRCVFVR
jgi:exopolysaccharide biosynthesis predicted pyruvyltransferase EpsI